MKLQIEHYIELIKILKSRFENNMERHLGIKWDDVLAKIESYNDIEGNLKARALFKMEETGGQPDVVFYDDIANEYIFIDCSVESPKGRRSLCYDRKALDSRKEYKPANSALDLAAEIGVEIISEEQYRKLQELGDYDLKTSSWIKTPDAIRKLGGALFCDKRYNHVFVYHNGADSYYGSRGFRGVLKV